MYQGTDAIDLLVDDQREAILGYAVTALRDDSLLTPEARIKYLDNRGRLRVDFT